MAGPHNPDISQNLNKKAKLKTKVKITLKFSHVCDHGEKKMKRGWQNYTQTLINTENHANKCQSGKNASQKVQNKTTAKK